MGIHKQHQPNGKLKLIKLRVGDLLAYPEQGYFTIFISDSQAKAPPIAGRVDVLDAVFRVDNRPQFYARPTKPIRKRTGWEGQLFDTLQAAAEHLRTGYITDRFLGRS